MNEGSETKLRMSANRSSEALKQNSKEIWNFLDSGTRS